MWTMTYLQWFVLLIVAVRFILLSYVVSKHGQEKRIEKHNAWSYVLGVMVWTILLYLSIKGI